MGSRRDGAPLHRPPARVFQLCSGGSVTDLIQTLARIGQTLTELQIAYIIKETIDVSVAVADAIFLERTMI